jgi:hypothetical protein
MLTLLEVCLYYGDLNTKSTKTCRVEMHKAHKETSATF